MKSESVSDRAPWGHSGLHEFTFSCHVCGMSATHRSQSVHFKALTLVCSSLSQYKAESFASRKPLSANPTEMVSQCQSSEQDYSYLFSLWLPRTLTLSLQLAPCPSSVRENVSMFQISLCQDLIIATKASGTVPYTSGFLLVLHSTLYLELVYPVKFSPKYCKDLEVSSAINSFSEIIGCSVSSKTLDFSRILNGDHSPYLKLFHLETFVYPHALICTILAGIHCLFFFFF